MLTILIIICCLSLAYTYYKLYKENKQLKQEYSTFREHYISKTALANEMWAEKFDAWCITKEKEIRKDSVKRSRSIIRGQATEHLAPFIMGNLNPKDFRFLGNPIDYIVFEGASDVTDGEEDEVLSVKFIDIKTGKSNLNKVQRRIRDCIKAGRVEFLLYNPDKD